jgi:putative intracellular protease/amidase
MPSHFGAEMSDRHIAVLIFEGFADWEPAYAITGLRRWGKLRVISYGYSAKSILSMGGLRIIPDRTVSELTPSEVRLLVLPGGDAWLTQYPEEPLHSCIQNFIAASVPVAGICAATIALARAGAFVDRAHTSNGSSFLSEHAIGYRDPRLYQNLLCVRDRGVISASGLGAVEFAGEIFAELDILNSADLSLFQRMYRNGDSG